jgi:FkbM family methyltransferase
MQTDNEETMSKLSTIRNYYRAIGLAGVFWAGWGRLTKTKRVLQVNNAQLKAPVQLRVPSSDVDVYAQIFFRQGYSVQPPKAPRVILDAGANIGLASLYFASQYPDAKIIAIEPEKENFEMLKKNISKYANIIPVQATLWERDGEIALIDIRRGSSGYITEELGESQDYSGKFRHRVPAISVETLLKERGLDEIDLFKIDIQGAEKEVFGGAKAWLGKVNGIIIELHERRKPGCRQAVYDATPDFREVWKRRSVVYLSR